MIVDNFDQILNLISFNNKDEFYFIQVIQRKKDGNDVKVSSGYRKIKSFYIFSKEELINNKDRIRELCKNNNARAYININVRNAKEISLHCIQEYSETILNDQCSFKNASIWDSCCGKYKARGVKQKCIVDIDNIEHLDKIKELINQCEGSKIITEIPTKSGVHLITNRFNRRYFMQLLVINNITDIEIKEESPTLLYYDSGSI